MTNRLFAGTHPILGGKGIWLSKPGVDVLTASSVTDFLLASNFKAEQMFQSGEIAALAHNTSIFVPWITTLPNEPVVMLRWTPVGNNYNYPFNSDAFRPGACVVQCTSGLAGGTFYHFTPTVTMKIMYSAFIRKMP